jgi:hypothetical protein
MIRLGLLAASVVAIFAAMPAFAADSLRPAFPGSWQPEEDDPLRFEAGVRYWATWGGQDAGFSPIRLSVRDQTHIVEAHGRIDDLSTQSYVRAHAGLGISTTGTYDFNGRPTPVAGGSLGGASNIAHAGWDFGWMPLGDSEAGFGIGPLIGYQYWKDAPDIGRGNYVTSVSPTTGTPTGGNSATDNLDIHALRLGITGRAEFGDMFDISAEVAGVPYAHVSGILGPHEFNTSVAGPPQTDIYKSSPTVLSGRGYGIMSEAMLGFHPTENLTLRLGGRAWYLEGQLDANFNAITVTDPGGANIIGQQGFVQASNWASLFRYGALFELTGRF